MEFNLKNLNIEKFKINFEDGKSLTLNPPKLSVIRRAAKMSDTDEDITNELVEIVALILSNNKEKRKIKPEFVEDNFDIGDLNLFIAKFFEWVNKTKQSPNF